jgi:hypothetical protein
MADYFTQHHSPAHHRLMHSRYQLEPDAIRQICSKSVIIIPLTSPTYHCTPILLILLANYRKGPSHLIQSRVIVKSFLSRERESSSSIRPITFSWKNNYGRQLYIEL